MPFKPAPPGQPAPIRTMKVPVMDRTHGETLPIGDDSIVKAVAALPFAGNTVGAGIIPFPQLTVAQYASLRAELVVYPEWSADILLRYHVLNEAARGALDDHWQARFAASLEDRAAFDRGFAVYCDWLRARRR